MKTSYTMEELQEKIDHYIATGKLFKPAPLTKKKIEALEAFVSAVDEKTPEIREIYEANIGKSHFCVSVEFPLEKKRRYMRYAHARRDILR